MEYVKTNTNTSLSKIVYRIGIPAPYSWVLSDSLSSWLAMALSLDS